MKLNWINKKGVISAEGEFKYEDGTKEKKTIDEFKKTIEYFDSVPILYGAEHPSSFTIGDVIGKANNFKIEGGKWYADFNFDMERAPKELIESFMNNKEIPASLSEIVDVDDENIQKNITPLHLLVHPDLNPRVKGAGLNIRWNALPPPEKKEVKENMTEENSLEKQVRNDAVSFLSEYVPKEDLEPLSAQQLYTLQKIVKKINGTRAEKKEDTAEVIELPSSEKNKIDFWAQYYEKKGGKS